jgi:polysaccharide biosynthesis transport protein
MSRADVAPSPSTAAIAATPVDDAGFRTLIGALARRWLLIASVAATGMMLGLIAGVARTERFSATTSVVLGAPRPQFPDLEGLISNLVVSKDTVANELELVGSRELARQVVTELELFRLPEFNPSIEQTTSEPSLLTTAKASVKMALSELRGLIGAADPLVASMPPGAARPPVEDVIDTFLDHLDVTLRGTSQVLDITFTGRQPELAALVANAVAERYLADRSAFRTQAAKQTSDWYRTRLTELLSDLQRREAAVASFREQNGLIEGARASLSAEQLSLLQEQLVEARTLLAQAEARYRSAQAGATRSGLADVQNSVNVQNLRLEEGRLQAMLGEVSQQFGDRHPRMIDLRQRLLAVQNDLRNEMAAIADGLAAEVAVQRGRVQQLEESIGQSEERLRGSGSAEAKLRVLEREAEAARNLYEEALKRFEASAPAASVEASDGRIISAAVIPSGPDGPAPLLLGALGLVFGGFCGVAAAFGLELRNRKFRNPAEAEEHTQLRTVGVVPPLRQMRGGKRGVAPEHQSVVQPNGAFAEIFRAIRNQVVVALPGRSGQRIVITSSVKGEGKTATAIALARSFACGGRRTVLVDGDLRLGRIDASMRQEGLPGLSDYLRGQAGASGIVARDTASEVHFVPCGRRGGPVADLLETERLAKLLNELSASFDVVIIDTPPILPVADAATFLRSADIALLVVDWARMHPEIVEAGATRLRELALGVGLGLILNNVDPRRVAGAGFSGLKVYYERRYASQHYYTSVK